MLFKHMAILRHRKRRTAGEATRRLSATAIDARAGRALHGPHRQPAGGRGLFQVLQARLSGLVASRKHAGRKKQSARANSARREPICDLLSTRAGLWRVRGHCFALIFSVVPFFNLGLRGVLLPIIFGIKVSGEKRYETEKSFLN